MTYEKKSVIELREIAKERKIKGISTLKKKELIEVLENYDQEHRRYNVNQNNLIQSIKKENIIRKNSQRI